MLIMVFTGAQLCSIDRNVVLRKHYGRRKCVVCEYCLSLLRNFHPVKGPITKSEPSLWVFRLVSRWLNKQVYLASWLLFFSSSFSKARDAVADESFPSHLGR